MNEKGPVDVIVVTFNFARRATSVSNPHITVTLDSGPADPAPQAILSGAAQVVGATVLQQVVGGLDGCNYRLSCEVDLPGGLHASKSGILPVRTQ